MVSVTKSQLFLTTVADDIAAVAALQLVVVSLSYVHLASSACKAGLLHLPPLDWVPVRPVSNATISSSAKTTKLSSKFQ